MVNMVLQDGGDIISQAAETDMQMAGMTFQVVSTLPWDGKNNLRSPDLIPSIKRTMMIYHFELSPRSTSATRPFYALPLRNIFFNHYLIFEVHIVLREAHKKNGPKIWHCLEEARRNT